MREWQKPLLVEPQPRTAEVTLVRARRAGQGAPARLVRQQLAEAQAYREQSQSAASRALHQSAAAAVLESLQVRFGKHRRASRWSHIAFVFSLDAIALANALSGAHLVISMVPAHMHLSIAKACIAHKAHLVTASYLTPEMRALDLEAKENGLVFLNECGLDPGIDHMSAARLLDGIRADGGEIVLFESFTGGLLSPASEGDNPWRYKFTWNPRNVVLAGQGGAVKFIQEGKYKYIPPHMVFRRTEFMNVEGYGRFEGLANRDSLKYREAYGLENVPTLYRGTLRRPGFARAWDSFVKLGMTDDS